MPIRKPDEFEKFLIKQATWGKRKQKSFDARISMEALGFEKAMIFAFLEYKNFLRRSNVKKKQKTS